MRLDVALVEQGFYASRERAKRAVEEGFVLVDGRVITKPSYGVEGQVLTTSGDPVPFVSRGGLKLSYGLDAFALSVTGLRAIDVGASTGGFTQVLLERGAASVCCVDVGHDQLAEALRQDPRVSNWEGTDLRNLDPIAVGAPFDFACVDVSFVSLTRILPSLFPLCRQSANLVCLVKPQFEVGRAGVGKKGVVRRPDLREQALWKVRDCASSLGFTVQGWVPSPIQGGEGNVEYLLWLCV